MNLGTGKFTQFSPKEFPGTEDKLNKLEMKRKVKVGEFEGSGSVLRAGMEHDSVDSKMTLH